jgi:hypothetical protein
MKQYSTVCLPSIAFWAAHTRRHAFMGAERGIELPQKATMRPQLQQHLCATSNACCCTDAPIEHTGKTCSCHQCSSHCSPQRLHAFSTGRLRATAQHSTAQHSTAQATKTQHNCVTKAIGTASCSSVNAEQHTYTYHQATYILLCQTHSNRLAVMPHTTPSSTPLHALSMHRVFE